MAPCHQPVSPVNENTDTTGLLGSSSATTRDDFSHQYVAPPASTTTARQVIATIILDFEDRFCFIFTLISSIPQELQYNYSMTIDIRKAGAVLIRDRKLLMTRAHDKHIFVAPGGKLDEGETVIEALIRELEEEIQVAVQASDLEELGVFHAPAAGQEHRMLEMTVFLVHELAR